MRSLRIAVSALLLCNALAAPARAQTTMDLQQAWLAARASAPLLASAQARRSAVQEAGVATRAARWPQLAVGLQAAAHFSAADGRSQQATATLQQSLFDRRLDARVLAAQALDEVQDARLRSSEQTLCAQVATLYIESLASTDALRFAQANQTSLTQQVQQAQERHRLGLGALVDVEQSRAALAAAVGHTAAAEQAAGNARDALALATGEPAALLKTLRDDASPVLPSSGLNLPGTLQDWSQSALAAHPSLQAAQASVQAAERALDGARAAHGPTVLASLNSSADVQRGAASTAGSTGTRWAVLLSLPLFAGGATQAGMRQAQFERQGLLTELESTRRQVLGDVQQQHLAVQAAAAQAEAGTQAVAAATRALQSLRSGQQLWIALPWAAKVQSLKD